MKNLECSPASALSGVPPWILPFPNIDIELVNQKKESPGELFFCCVLPRLPEFVDIMDSLKYLQMDPRT